MKCVLNVGGGEKSIPIPTHYTGWRHYLLDIDSRRNPDIVLDARDLRTLPPATYDAVLCSHNLEHYHRHHGAKVLAGFHHVLKPDGFAEITVPNLLDVMQQVVQRGMDLDDILYQSPAGPIMVRDVIYGYRREIEQMDNEFYAHKTGFSPNSLARFVSAYGFAFHAIACLQPLAITGYFFKSQPSPEQMTMLGIRQG